MALDAAARSALGAFVLALDARASDVGPPPSCDPTATCTRICPVLTNPDADGFDGPSDVAFNADGTVMAIAVDCNRTTNVNCDCCETTPSGNGIFIYQRTGDVWNFHQHIQAPFFFFGSTTERYQEGFGSLRFDDSGNVLTFFLLTAGSSDGWVIEVWKRPDSAAQFVQQTDDEDQFNIASGDFYGLAISATGQSIVWMIHSLDSEFFVWSDFVNGIWDTDSCDIFSCFRWTRRFKRAVLNADGQICVMASAYDPNDITETLQIVKVCRSVPGYGFNTWFRFGSCNPADPTVCVTFSPKPAGVSAEFGDDMWLAGPRVLFGDPGFNAGEGACFEHLLGGATDPVLLQRTYRNPDPANYSAFSWGTPAKDGGWAVFKANYAPNPYARGGWVAKWETVNGIASYRPKYKIEGDPSVSSFESIGLRNPATHNAPSGAPWWAVNQQVDQQRTLVGTIVCNPTDANIAIVGVVQSVTNDGTAQTTVIDLDQAIGALPADPFVARAAGLWSGVGVEVCATIAQISAGDVLYGTCPAPTVWTGGACGADAGRPPVTWQFQDLGTNVRVTLVVCLATGGTALEFTVNETVLFVE